MNAVEEARARWRRFETALKADLVSTSDDVERLILEIVDRLAADDAESGLPNSVPDPELVDRLVDAALRRRALADSVLPAFERVQRAAVYTQPRPLPIPPRRG